VHRSRQHRKGHCNSNVESRRGNPRPSDTCAKADFATIDDSAVRSFNIYTGFVGNNDVDGFTFCGSPGVISGPVACDSVPTSLVVWDVTAYGKLNSAYTANYTISYGSPFLHIGIPVSGFAFKVGVEVISGVTTNGGLTSSFTARAFDGGAIDSRGRDWS
jgi:hypothetical protein